MSMASHRWSLNSTNQNHLVVRISNELFHKKFYHFQKVWPEQTSLLELKLDLVLTEQFSKSNLLTAQRKKLMRKALEPSSISPWKSYFSINCKRMIESKKFLWSDKSCWPWTIRQSLNSTVLSAIRTNCTSCLTTVQTVVFKTSWYARRPSVCLLLVILQLRSSKPFSTCVRRR